MEIILIVGAVVLVIFIYRKLTTPTSSDKLTLLQFENWLPMYVQGSLFQKSNMATALALQSIQLANTMGFSMTANEFMREKNREKTSSIDVIDNWLDYITSEMTNDISMVQMNSLPARTVCALALVRLENPIRFRELLTGRYH